MTTAQIDLPHYLASDAFDREVRRLILSAQPREYALVSLDFDNFNYINDLFGYDMGNETLRRLAIHFSAQLTQGEYFSNIHADHFSFWVKADLTPSVAGRFSTLANVDESLIGVLPAHYNLVNSGGIVLVEDPNEDLSTLMDKSNFARKRAKGSHRNTFLYYDKKMDDEVAWRKIITLTMASALRDREFQMYLQPKILIDTGEVMGAEALVRWRSEKYGMIYPDQFIPILEQNGFIRHLDFFMLGEACRFLRSCMDTDLPALPISVNFSKVHLHNLGFVEEISSLARRHGVPTSLIEIEFTENIFWEDFQALVAAAGTLKRHGFRVSLDDFGSAYSSLNCLKDLPLDIIKIDKGFFDLSNTDRGRVIITKIVGLIKSLRLIPVMEGVETEEQAQFLRELGCDLGQGYYYAKPMPLASYVDFLRRSPTLHWTPDAEALDVATAAEPVTPEELRSRVEELEIAVAAYREEQESLRLSEERYRLIVEQSNDSMFEWDFESDSIKMSGKYEKLFGRPPLSGQLSTNTTTRSRIHPDDLPAFENWISSTFRKSNCVQADFRVQTVDGRHIWLRCRSSPIFDRHGTPIKAVGVFSNIDQQKNELAYLVRVAQMDSLTHLYNKEETRRRIETCLAEHPDEPGAVFIIDIDNFKGVNDTLGHQLGDTVLVEAANKIKKLFCDVDVVGRVGGDEFAVFAHNLSLDALTAKAEALVLALRSTYFGATQQYHLSGSVGIALSPSHGTTFDALYRFADVALYEAKRQGKDRYAIYQKSMTGAFPDNRTPLERTERFLTTYFENDFTYSVFEMLYETRDMHATIQKILALTGERFGVDRAYIIQNTPDGLHLSNTFEWCAEGITPEISHLQNIPLDGLQSYYAAYNKEGLLCCNDISVMDPITRSILEPQGIQSLLHCAIFDGGDMTGFIGFDLCREQRPWHGDELATLGYLSRILSVFLLKNQTMMELTSSNQNYVQMLDNLNGYVYVINLDSYQLLYLNKRTAALGITLGDKCYHAAFGHDEPCVNCPARQLTHETPYCTEDIYSKVLDTWISSAASLLHWTGCERAALVCCTDVSKYCKGAGPQA